MPRGRPKGSTNKGMAYKKRNRRKGRYYFWRVGTVPLEEAFIKRHSELTNTSFEVAYNEVMRVMVTLQDMLLTHPRFMLPGIGVIGIAENTKRGIVIASSTFWWSPGLVNLLAVGPGWENAPLNGYLTADLLNNLNKHIKNMKSEDRKILSPKQFYEASDFNLEGITSDQMLEYHTDDRFEADKANANQLRIARSKIRKGLITRMKDHIQYLEGLIDKPFTPFELGEDDDKV